MRLIISIIIFSFFSIFLFAQQTPPGIKGKIVNADTGQPMTGVNIVAKTNGVFVYGDYTDHEGNYEISLDPKVYDLEISYMGFKTRYIKQVVVNNHHFTVVNLLFSQQDLQDIPLETVVLTAQKEPLIEHFCSFCPSWLSQGYLIHSPHKSIPHIAAGINSELSILDQ